MRVINQVIGYSSAIVEYVVASSLMSHQVRLSPPSRDRVKDMPDGYFATQQQPANYEVADR